MILLGVEKSATGRQWIGPNDAVRAQAEQLSRLGGLDPLLATLYARRGANLDNLEDFETPKLKNLMPNPRALKDCDRAALRILKAIETKEPVAIFGDYDVDGATSTALLVDYFRFFDQEPEIYIPDRLSEGYGPNTPAMEALAETASLIICVDCGTLSFEPIAAARAKGAEVIVIDHHIAGEALPDAIVVNPNRQDETQELGYLSAAAVVFLVLVELNRLQTGDKPNLLQALDLVALSTVADVAPLIEANRAFVKSGLERMKLGERIGLKTLTQKLLGEKNVSASDIGFTLGPRLNAGGRLGESALATKLLTSNNQIESEMLVEELESLNSARREIEATVTEEARAQIERNQPTKNFVYAYGENWHTGVLGIVASRLKSNFDLPAIAFGLVDGVYHGSARSVDGIDLGNAVARLADEELILKGGGHKMAAGLSVLPEKLQTAMQRLDSLLERQTQNRAPSAVQVDGMISTDRVDIDLLDKIESAGPYGAMAPEPIFVIPDLKLISRRVLKDTHLKYSFQPISGRRIDVLSFNSVGSPIELTDDKLFQNFHLALSFSRNIWQGRVSVSAQLQDWAPA